ncbi:hypothetical protein ACOMHN_003209 [Nucella lapillus]
MVGPCRPRSLTNCSAAIVDNPCPLPTGLWWTIFTPHLHQAVHSPADHKVTGVDRKWPVSGDTRHSTMLPLLKFPHNLPLANSPPVG